MPVIKIESCDKCPYCTLTNDDYLLCTLTGRKLDYFLDYQGKLASDCPLEEDDEND